MVVIHGRPHQGAGNQEGFCSIDPSLLNGDLAIGDNRIPYQTVGIDRPVGHPGIVGVAEEVIHPVNVKLTVQDAREPVFPFQQCS